jgi:diguanylate cyclase (GGDEF)-like protein
VESLIEKVFCAVVTVDFNFTINDLSFRGRKWLGLHIPHAYTSFLDKVYHKDKVTIQKAIAERPQVFNRYLRLMKNGDTPTSVKLIGTLTEDKTQYVFCIADISDYAGDIELIHAAEHDPLTGLPNRTRLIKDVNNIIQSGSEPFVVMMFDLDGFKSVNDNYGHKAGDELLIEVARRCSLLAKATKSKIYRLAGDEFIFILGPSFKFNPRAVAIYLQKQISSPYSDINPKIKISASIGSSVYPEEATNYTELLQKADNAMYVSKRQGKAQYTRYEDISDLDDIPSNLSHASIFGTLS